MMFLWKPDMIRFMRDASEHTGYHADLAARIVPHLKEGARVCDAGCGLGYLSLALAPLAAQVTAVDRNADALSVLRENCEKRGVSNVEARHCDMTLYRSEQPFDAMVFCMYGSFSEILALAKKHCGGKAVIIKRSSSSHQFSKGRQRQETEPGACTKLDLLGVPYWEQNFTATLDQPLRSMDDARRFFALYRPEGAPEMTEDEIMRRVVRTENEEFPYLLPSSRQMGMIVFDAADIPETEETEYADNLCATAL